MSTYVLLVSVLLSTASSSHVPVHVHLATAMAGLHQAISSSKQRLHAHGGWISLLLVYLVMEEIVLPLRPEWIKQQLQAQTMCSAYYIS